MRLISQPQRIPSTFCRCCLILATICTISANRADAQVIFGDNLNSQWANWSWDTTVDLQNTDFVFSGSYSISAKFDFAWAGFYLSTNTPFPSESTDELVLRIHGGPTGGQSVNLSLVDGDYEFLFVENMTLTSDWNIVVINLNEIGDPYEISGVVVQDASGGPQNTFYVDGVALGDFEGEQDPQPGIGPAIVINPSQINREINDDIYGINFVDQNLGAELGLPLHRWGGNSTTRYNYTNDTTNTASDFFFENHVAAIGSTSDDFVTNNMAIGADTIMTISMVDYVSKTSPEILGGYSVTKYGPQQEVNPYRPDHGNGIRLDGTPIANNDPLDTSIPVDESFAQGWVSHFVSEFDTAANGGVKFYALDNEPMLWNSTHMDVHSDPASYDEVTEKGIDYAVAIKTADPSAQVLGPVVWGWTAYFYSALDAAPGGAWWLNPLDRNAHGGLPFLVWYLQQMAQYEADNGQRLLDYLDIHFYPQQSNVALNGPGDLNRQDLRYESTRSLWDPDYLDNSWINETVMLIPRMRAWIDQHYPGTKLALTEYNFGAWEHVTGAITQADVLGIFGREGLDLATIWASPDPADPVSFAFRMFRNYDGQQLPTSRFGSTSISAQSTNSDQVSVFAARREFDDALTIMLINKSRQPLIVPVSLTEPGNQMSQVFVYGSADRHSIRQLADLSVENGELEIILEASSITLLELDLATVLLGDVNLDGAVNLLDVGPFVARVSSGTYQTEADTNQDGQVNLLDVAPFIAILGG